MKATLTGRRGGACYRLSQRMASAFKAALSDHHVRVFGLAIAYLCKCGRDITVEITKAAVRRRQQLCSAKANAADVVHSSYGERGRHSRRTRTHVPARATSPAAIAQGAGAAPDATPVAGVALKKDAVLGCDLVAMAHVSASEAVNFVDKFPHGRRTNSALCCARHRRPRRPTPPFTGVRGPLTSVRRPAYRRPSAPDAGGRRYPGP